MPSVLHEIKEHTHKEDDDATKILKQANKWYRDNYAPTGFAKPEGNLSILSPNEIDEVDVLVKMSEYSAWSAYYAHQSSRWKAIISYLEGLYETLTKQYVVTSTRESSDRKKECAAKVIYSPIERAKQLAAIRYSEAREKTEVANTQYQLCSRIITFRGDELRSDR